MVKHSQRMWSTHAKYTFALGKIAFGVEVEVEVEDFGKLYACNQFLISVPIRIVLHLFSFCVYIANTYSCLTDWIMIAIGIAFGICFLQFRSNAINVWYWSYIQWLSSFLGISLLHNNYLFIPLGGSKGFSHQSKLIHQQNLKQIHANSNKRKKKNEIVWKTEKITFSSERDGMR